MLAANVQWNVFHLLAAKCLDKRGYRTTSLKKKFALTVARFLPEPPMIRFVEASKQKKAKKFIFSWELLLIGIRVSIREKCLKNIQALSLRGRLFR